MAHDGPAGVADPLLWFVPVLVLVTSAAPYLRASAVYGARRGRAWSRWRTTSWLAGTALLAFALSPGMAGVAHEARGHMVQHVLLGMLAPIGLVLGAPVTLLLGSSRVVVGRRVTRVLRSRPFHLLSHPVTAATLNVGGMYVLYLAPLYALSMHSSPVHHLVHLHFVAAGYLFTWAIAGPDPAPGRPGMRTRVVVLVLAGGVHGHLGKVLYARAGELPPGSGHAGSEMEVAAQVMYYGGDVAHVLLAAALFSTWWRARRRRPV